MDREQVIILLKLLSAAFPTMKVEGAVLDAWCILMEDEDAGLMFNSAKFICKNSDSSFMPTPSALIAQARKLATGQLSTAAEVWARGPVHPDNTAFDSDVWNLWGGYSRWGTLPDPVYAQNYVEAHQVLSFARKDFIELFNSTQRTAACKQDFITHSDAGRFLKKLQEHSGSDVKKLVG